MKTFVFGQKYTTAVQCEEFTNILATLDQLITLLNELPFFSFSATKGHYCCVYKCHNRTGGRDPFKFFNVIRRDLAQTSLWIDKIRRMNEDGSDWKPNKNTIICGAHFVSKTMSTETNNPDYIPSIFPEQYKTQPKTEDDVARHERAKVKTLRQFDLAPPVNAPNVPPPGPTVLEKLQNLDLSDLTAESVIVVQSLVIKL